MSLRVLHIGDLHLGIETYGRPLPGAGHGTRVEDYLRCLDTALERAPEVDLVLFAGDIYKNSAPNPTVQREFATRVRRASRHAPIVLIPGNHDVPNSAGRANSVDIFSALEVDGIRVLRKPEVVEVATRSGPAIVAALPFVPRSLLLAREEAAEKTIAEALAWISERLVGWINDELATDVAALRERLGEQTPAILLAHYTAAGAQFGGYRGMVSVNEIQIPPSALRNEAFDYVALGHIHRHQRIGLPGDQPPVVYAGSVERVDFSEEREEKVAILAQVARRNTTWELLPLPARRFVTIRAEADPEDPTGSVLQAIEKEAARLPGSVVRVAYTLERGLPNVPDGELRQALQGAHTIASIRREIPEHGPRERHAGLTTQLSPLDALREYLKIQPELAERAEELLRCAEPLIAEVAHGPG